MKNNLKKCSIDNCNKDVYAKKLCQNHYHHLRCHGDPVIKNKDRFPFAIIEKRKKNKELCEINGCNKKTHCRNLCGKHYDHFSIHGHPTKKKSRANIKNKERNFKNYKISPEEQKEIKKLFNGYEHWKRGLRHSLELRLAKKYSVHFSTIYFIYKNITYKNPDSIRLSNEFYEKLE
ncbi:MAG TPA: hypothetical protein VNU45_19125 [Rummeliibacillus sp.]|nr:hypothetical protein [Rummeliibacillus sp.]